MKKADIKTDGTPYFAEVFYRQRTKVTPLELGVSREANRQGRADGVRVRVEQRAKDWSKELAPGDEVVIATRDVVRVWTAEDDARLAEREANEARAEAITDRLVALGFGVSRAGGPRFRDLVPDARVGPGGVTLTLDGTERLLGLLGLIDGLDAFEQPEAVCDKCGAQKGLQAVGESCNNNCGGKVVARREQDGDK